MSKNKSYLKNLCKRCKYKDTCTSLCEVAKEYVNQDFVGSGDELSLPTLVLDNMEKTDIWLSRDNYSSSELKGLIILLYIQDKTSYEIAYHLPCSRRYISRIIKEYKVKLDKNRN